MASTQPINLLEFESQAKARMETATWDYFRGGANDEIALSRNLRALAELSLHYRVLADVERRSMNTTVIGQPVASPILVAPSAFHKLAHPEGELATVSAVSRHNTITILSTLSTTAVETVVEHSTSPVWFQLYIYKDRDLTLALVDRVARAGVRALVLTVDVPCVGRREADVRNQFTLPKGLRLGNVVGDRATLPEVDDDSGLAAYFSELLDPSLTWSDVAWFAQQTSLPVVVKGIIRADDALRARDHGAAAVIVSNHGGRQLDAAPATIDVLPAITAAVGDSIEIYMDGGIRRGTDIVKALAFGARAVLVGRPVLWGLAVDGMSGVDRVLTLLEDELDLAMALCGCSSLAAITHDLVHP